MTDERTQTYGTLRVQDLILGVDVSHLAEVCTVKSLQPMMKNVAGVIGCINLRGHLIPVLDAAPFCGLSERDGPPPFAAILKYNDTVLAIGVDEITGLSSVKPQRIQSFARTGADGQTVHLRAFLDLAQTVIVLDAPTIFDRPDIPTASAQRYNAQSKADVDRDARKLLIFGVGDALFSLAASDVYGTVPRKLVEQNALTSGISLGSIDYRERRVPVVCTVSLIGIGRQRAGGPSELVILQFADDKLLGLAVESITNLRSIPDAAFSSTPRAIAARFPFIDKVLVAPDGEQIYNIDVRALQADPQLLALAGISVTKTISEAPQKTSRGGAVTRAAENRKYLIYECGGEIATPIEQITSILEQPEKVLPLVGKNRGLVGLFSLDGRSVPMIDLRQDFGTAQSDPSHVRILLVGTADQQIGFVVSRVHSIASAIRSYIDRSGSSDEIMVQLVVAGKPKMFRLVDLVEIASALGASESGGAEYARHSVGV